MLFILFINDFSNITTNCVFAQLYADDLKLYTSLTSLDDCHNVQLALSNFLIWSDYWQLKAKVSKCHMLHLHKTTHSWNSILITYALSRVT